MISTDLFFLVSLNRIDPDYGSDDGDKVRFRNPIPRQTRSDSAVRVFRDLLDFLIVLLIQGIDERFLQRILHRLHEFGFLFLGSGAEIVDVERDRRLRRQPYPEFVGTGILIHGLFHLQFVLQVRDRHDPAVFEFFA